MENICYLQMRKIIAIISKINRREAMKKYEIIAVEGIKKRGLPDHSLDLQVWQETGAGSTVVRRVRTGI